MTEDTETLDHEAKRDVARLFNRMERAYLAVLRTGALIVASLLLLYAAWLALSGFYKVSRDVKSVKEVPATVSAEEVTDIDVKSAQNTPKDEAADPFKRERAYYRDFAKRYFGLYRAKFEPYLQANDPKTNARDFDARFVDVNGRLESIEQGDLNFAADKDDLESLLKTMTAAAEAKVTKDRLQAYQKAKKSKVSHTVTDMKTERYCSYYGYYIDQCINWDTREVPVKRTVTETKLPDGVLSPGDLFGAYHNKYVATLIDHRSENAADANTKRTEIMRDNATGIDRLWTAIKVIGSFVIVMFLFLLIALERHQRKIARAQDPSV